MFKKIPSDKINCTKNALFFFRELQIITVLLLICDSYKLLYIFSIFDSVAFLLEFVFSFNKMIGLFNFKTS